MNPAGVPLAPCIVIPLLFVILVGASQLTPIFPSDVMRSLSAKLTLTCKELSELLYFM